MKDLLSKPFFKLAISKICKLLNCSQCQNWQHSPCFWKDLRKKNWVEEMQMMLADRLIRVHAVGKLGSTTFRFASLHFLHLHRDCKVWLKYSFMFYSTVDIMGIWTKILGITSTTLIKITVSPVGTADFSQVTWIFLWPSPCVAAILTWWQTETKVSNVNENLS